MSHVDALITFMTIEENMVFYGKCRGYSKRFAEYESDRLLIQFEMYRFKDMLPKHLRLRNEPVYMYPCLKQNV